jgi:hemerythrin superfamily protein
MPTTKKASSKTTARKSTSARGKSTTSRAKSTSRAKTTARARTTTARSRTSTTGRKRTTTTARKRTSTSRRRMDVLTFLKKEHDTVEGLMRRFKAKGTNARQRLSTARRICKELLVHAKMEEQSFYPEMMRVGEVSPLVREGMEEHHKVEQLVHRIMPMKTRDEHFMPAMQELEKNVMHHVREEEGQMFPKIKKACKADHLMDLTNRLKQTKMTVKEQMSAKAQTRPSERRIREEVAVGEMARR